MIVRQLTFLLTSVLLLPIFVRSYGNNCENNDAEKACLNVTSFDFIFIIDTIDENERKKLMEFKRGIIDSVAFGDAVGLKDDVLNAITSNRTEKDVTFFRWIHNVDQKIDQSHAISNMMNSLFISVTVAFNFMKDKQYGVRSYKQTVVVIATKDMASSCGSGSMCAIAIKNMLERQTLVYVLKFSAGKYELNILRPSDQKEVQKINATKADQYFYKKVANCFCYQMPDCQIKTKALKCYWRQDCSCSGSESTLYTRPVSIPAINNATNVDQCTPTIKTCELEQCQITPDSGKYVNTSYSDWDVYCPNGSVGIMQKKTRISPTRLPKECKVDVMTHKCGDPDHVLKLENHKTSTLDNVSQSSGTIIIVVISFFVVIVIVVIVFVVIALKSRMSKVRRDRSCAASSVLRKSKMSSTNNDKKKNAKKSVTKSTSTASAQNSNQPSKSKTSSSPKKI